MAHSSSKKTAKVVIVPRPSTSGDKATTSSTTTKTASAERPSPLEAGDKEVATTVETEAEKVVCKKQD